MCLRSQNTINNQPGIWPGSTRVDQSAPAEAHLPELRRQWTTASTTSWPPWAFSRQRAWEAKVVTSVKVVEKRISEEVAIGQAAIGGSFAGSASINGGGSSAMPSICI
jgi:hypothetical protein